MPLRYIHAASSTFINDLDVTYANLIPSAFQLTLYAFLCNKAILLQSMETGWAPGNPVFFQWHIFCTFTG